MHGIHKTGWIEVGVKAYKMCGVVHCVSSCQFGVEVRDVSEVGKKWGKGIGVWWGMNAWEGERAWR